MQAIPLARLAPWALLGLAAATSSCRSAYYGAMESFGVHKRDILVDRVEEGREAQHEAKEQFQDALEAFRQVASFEGGDLEELYARLKREHEHSERRVRAVRGRIEDIERVAADLFDEWKDEIGEIESPDLRQRSEASLRETRSRYEGLIDAMKRAEAKMQPVLVSFKDHVLFLKHNLNARAIASLQGDLESIEGEVEALIREMERSIAEADAFIEAMESGTT